MEKIRVNTARPYDVTIGAGLIDKMEGLIPWDRVKKGSRAVIITDENVAPLYGERTAGVLTRCGFQVLMQVVPAGEEAKSGTWYLRLLSFMAENHVSRSDTIFALGGGVVGDLSGFLAATYLRGTGFVQIPTTLLAAVDSSVGGKTAINLPEGKNLAGAFYQPAAVIMDTDTLDTLTAETFADGCAEVIKYAMIRDKELFGILRSRVLTEHRDDRELVEGVIARCVSIKQDVVSQDENDRGLRNLLNFGHTVGHSIEKNSGFTISHGSAVAMGMSIVTSSAERAGICPKGLADELRALLKRYGLPTETEYPTDKLASGMLSDKKIDGGSINMILPHSIGDCRIENVELSKLPEFLAAGRGNPQD